MPHFPPKIAPFPHDFVHQYPSLQATAPINAPTFRLKSDHFRAFSPANNPIGVSLLAGQC